MSPSISSITEIEVICRQAATPFQQGPLSYQATTKQIFFFILTWLKKKRVVFHELSLQASDGDAINITDQVCATSRNLGHWGPIISRLQWEMGAPLIDRDKQQQREREWELLRIQMEKAAGRKARAYGRFDLIDQVLEQTLLKLLEMLRKMITGEQIEAAGTPADVVLLVEKAFDDVLRGTYDYSSPFYAYVKRIVQNNLIDQLRAGNRHAQQFVPLETVEGDLTIASTWLDAAVEDDEEALRYETARRNFQQTLTRLLEQIDQLPQRQRQAITCTLAARPQFWRAVELTKMPIPPDFPEQGALTDDTEIAAMLDVQVNSLRVNRNHAKRRIMEANKNVGRWLERLMEA